MVFDHRVLHFGGHDFVVGVSQDPLRTSLVADLAAPKIDVVGGHDDADERGYLGWTKR